MDDVKDDIDIIKEIRERFNDAQSAWETTYSDMLDDLEFVNGDQWPRSLKAEREADGRPCLTINKLANFGDQTIGDIRQNEPSIKVKPVDSGSDPDVAEILTGLIRNIEVQSNAEIAYDTAAESAVWCGKGSFRVVTEYSDDDTFDQDIRIKRIKNPFTVYWDPSAQEWDKSDARYVFVTERIPRDEFTQRYPDAGISDHAGGKDKDYNWGDDKTVRIAEYFVKEAVKKKLYLLRDPVTQDDVVRDAKIDGWDVIRERDIEGHKITWYKTNGSEILEGPTEWPGKHFPICEVWGKEINIEGRSIYRGMVRHAKDPQRLYNFSRSHSAELTSLAPKAPYLVTSKMVAQYQNMWQTAHKKNWPFLVYDVDPLAPGSIPKRADSVSQSTAIMQEIQISDQEVHDTTGLQQASLGQKSNEKSGRAILARQREGDVANYVFYDNLGRAVAYCGRVLLDLIPRIYDTARVVRLIGQDGEEAFVPVNQPVETQGPDGRVIEKIFDLTTGKYDVVISVGPGYTTQRDEAADMMMEFMRVIPAAGPIIADLVAKNMDWPGADEISDRLRSLLPPQVLGAAGGGQQGPPPPPEPPPNPMDELKGQKLKADIEGRLLDNRKRKFEIASRETGFGQPSQKNKE